MSKPPSLKQQVDKLVTFLLWRFEGEPSQSQGAVDTAIRLLEEMHVMKQYLDELGAPLASGSCDRDLTLTG